MRKKNKLVKKISQIIPRKIHWKPGDIFILRNENIYLGPTYGLITKEFHAVMLKRVPRGNHVIKSTKIPREAKRISNPIHVITDKVLKLFFVTAAISLSVNTKIRF